MTQLENQAATGADRPVKEPRTISSALIVEDHPLFCDALMLTLQLVADIHSVRTAHSIADCLAALESGARPDVILLDLNLPDSDGLDSLLRVRNAAGEADILIVSSITDSKIIGAAIEVGAAGYVPKHSQRAVFQAALRTISEGRTFLPEGFIVNVSKSPGDEPTPLERLQNLTEQQARILRLICQGKLNKQIAFDLSISEATVKAHVTVMMRKLGVQNRTQAVLIAQTAKFDNLSAS
ncbi:LuxR C-terminal-related transcriptional regulator [Roseovarius atlanticus]|uniref:LuxR C-terminal-related transcriptional regulator n=1 Tax=Roseovarius atlanticus TaxID=1641875 RepID=UPI001C98B4B2|nr:response regulator transcription factor [Roseovarius atlanticus]MBY5986328.1 response regulator transcription factor [Roseovarius atlanticus]MBY6124968.1 response regulator transcription factor [Roseovarius atlanticus]MBY6150571.1 response regulator transcription factor [Roseovarius atlanticus]